MTATSLFVLPDGWANNDDDDGPSLLDYRHRITNILGMHCNETCADCSAPNPQWASLLLSPNREGGGVEVEGLGAVVCQQCAIHHFHELGEKRCFIKYLQYFHEWTHPELDLLEHCGNDLVNEVYEATFIAPTADRDEEQQARFIKNKYKKCRYRDQEAMEEALELIHLRTRLAKNPPKSQCSSYASLGTVSGHSLFDEEAAAAPVPATATTTKQQHRRDSCLSLSSDLTGTSCFSLCDLKDALGDDDEADDFAYEGEYIRTSTGSLPSMYDSVVSFADDADDYYDDEVQSVDRRQSLTCSRRRRSSRRHSRPSATTHKPPARTSSSTSEANMERSGQTEPTEEEMTYLTKASSQARSLSPCPATRYNIASHAA